MAAVSSVHNFAQLNLQVNHTCAQIKSLEYYVELPHIFERNFGLVVASVQKEEGSSLYELSSKLQMTVDRRPDALLDRPSKPVKERSHLVEALDLSFCWTHQEKKVEDFVFQELALEYFNNIQRLQKCLLFLKEPTAACPRQLPFMTQEVALGILQVSQVRLKRKYC